MVILGNIWMILGVKAFINFKGLTMKLLCFIDVVRFNRNNAHAVINISPKIRRLSLYFF